MLQKRSSIILTVMIAMLLALIVRFCYLQIYDGSRLTKAASAQRMTNSKLEKPRGNILDKNGIPFTSRTKKISLILKPFSLRGKEIEIQKICNIIEQDYESVKREIESKREPIMLEISEEQKDAIKSANIQGVSFMGSLRRYDNNSIAKHIVGYLGVSDQIGQAGIERFYEDALKFDEKNNLSVITDARNNVVEGLGYRIIKQKDDNKKLDVKLTLDYHIQRIVEDVMDKNSVTGAVVVEDVYTGDIVAIASKPDFSQVQVDKYLSSSNNELFNRAVASYNLGSIFKIIDVATAFEKGYMPQEEFFCPGYVRVGNREFKCSSYEKGGHGEIDFTQAFALSCNPYFIDMGIRIGYPSIRAMAVKFGLGSISGVKQQGIDESAGNLPPASKFILDGDTANISIGQGDIMATPLQAADIAATVANGGIKNRVNIVDSIIDRDGNKVRDIRVRDGERIISRENADKIKELMLAVTEIGTGTKAMLTEYGGAGGKTGSAETGQYINGEKVVHAWFAGFFPKLAPRYSISVFVENGKSGGVAATPIFAEIAEEIMKKGL